MCKYHPHKGSDGGNKSHRLQLHLSRITMSTSQIRHKQSPTGLREWFPVASIHLATSLCRERALSPVLLWMDEILHPLKHPGHWTDDSPCKYQQTMVSTIVSTWCAMDFVTIHSSRGKTSGAKWMSTSRPSTCADAAAQIRNMPTFVDANKLREVVVKPGTRVSATHNIRGKTIRIGLRGMWGKEKKPHILARRFGVITSEDPQ